MRRDHSVDAPFPQHVADPNDSQSWYLLGRAYMAGQNYNKAYEAYQQAVYRDGKNPTFWCSIGVLYYQINQFRDALDAYSRAIRLNPYISEVWFDLGSLYESCNNQISDAIDAYSRAAELDPDNPHIKQRLVLLRNAEANGGQVPSAPMPQDVHPTAYANNPGMAPGPPSQIGGAPPPNAYPGGPAGPQLAAAGPRGDAPGGRDLPGPGGLPRAQSPANDPFRGAPPSIPNIDDRGTKGPAHTPLAPMDAPPASHLGPSGASRHEYSQGQSQFPRVNSPSPRHDPYGRGMASPRESPRARNMDAASQGGRSVSGQSMQQHPVDSYGRPLTSSRDREREMDWERSRAPGGSGRATPKEEPFHPSGGPSPVPQRATATRGERGDYFTSPYERNRPPQERDPRMSPLYHNAPPQEYERGSSNSASRYDPRNDRPADARPAKASRRPDVSTTNIDRERQRDEAGVRDELDGPGSEPVGTLSAQKQKGKRTGKMGKEDAESGRASPLGQRLEGPASSRKKKEPISRPESPLVSRASENNGSKNSRLDAKSAAGGKKGASKIKDDRQAPSPAASARAATPERPQHRPASVEQTPETSRTRDFSRAGRPQSPARSDTSTGSNRPLAARAPSRLVDEDYDGGAADALMGLAGAASLSTTNGNSELPRAAQEEPQANNQNKEMSEYPPAGAASDDASARGQESAETDAERLADQHRVANEEAEANRVGTPPTDVARQRAGSTLGKRPFEEDESHKDEDNATKRLRNGSSPRPVAEAGPSPPAARSPQGHTQEAPNHDREPSNHSRAVPQEEEQAPADGLPSPRPVPPSPQRSLPEPGELEESRPEEQQKAPSKSSEDREAPEAGEVKARVDEGDAPKMSMEKAAEQPNEEAKASGEAPETAAAAA